MGSGVIGMNEQFAIVPPGAATTVLLLGLAVVCLGGAVFAHLRWAPTRPSMLAKVLLLVIAGLTVRVYWGAHSSQVIISDEYVQFQVPAFYARTVANGTIEWSGVRIVDLDAEPSLIAKYRTNGAALPGYRLGWFMLPGGQKAWLAVTETSRVVVVPQRGGPVHLVSVSEPERFLRYAAAFEEPDVDDEETND